jgi:hypothetical protein
LKDLPELDRALSARLGQAPVANQRCLKGAGSGCNNAVWKSRHFHRHTDVFLDSTGIENNRKRPFEGEVTMVTRTHSANAQHEW